MPLQPLTAAQTSARVHVEARAADLSAWCAAIFEHGESTRREPRAGLGFQAAGLAELQYMIRTPTIAMAEQVTTVLDRNAEAAAAMTGCRWEKHRVCKSRPGLANHAMTRVVWEAMQAAGPPQWDEPVREIAREIQRGLGLTPMHHPFIAEMGRLVPPEEAEAIRHRDLPPSQSHSTSNDYTDMCWHAPTARFYIARPALKAPQGFAYPNWVMNALGGIPATIDPMVQTAARVLALSALRLLKDAGARDAAMAEFKTRTGGGIGSAWLPPLCDYPPPIHFRWPEYVTTPRGLEPVAQAPARGALQYPAGPGPACRACRGL